MEKSPESNSNHSTTDPRWEHLADDETNLERLNNSNPAETQETTDIAETEETETPNDLTVEAFLEQYHNRPTSEELAKHWDELCDSINLDQVNAFTDPDTEFYKTDEDRDALVIEEIADLYQPDGETVLSYLTKDATNALLDELKKPEFERNPESLQRLHDEYNTLSQTQLLMQANPTLPADTALQLVHQRSQAAHDMFAESDPDAADKYQRVSSLAENFKQGFPEYVEVYSHTIGRDIATATQDQFYSAKHPSERLQLADTPSELDPNIIS